MAEFIINDLHIQIQKHRTKDTHVLAVQKEYSDTLDTRTTLEQLETLGKGILAYVETQK